VEEVVLVVADNIRKYRADYNYNPPNAISFMPAIASTSGRIHSDFVCLPFIQVHRASFSQLKSKCGKILAKSAALRIILNIDGSPVTSRSHSHPSHSQTLPLALSFHNDNNKIDGSPVVSRSHTHSSHSQTSRLLTSSLSLGVPVPLATQCIRVV
jgi:hypothetical protein